MKRDLLDIIDDFEWATGIPVVPVIIALSLICSIAAVVITIVTS